MLKKIQMKVVDIFFLYDSQRSISHHTLLKYMRLIEMHNQIRQCYNDQLYDVK